MKNRIWLIGSGPSLKNVDFTLLKDEVTMACNKVNLFPQFQYWKPTYYYMVDFDSIAGIQWKKRILDVLPHVKHAWLWDAFKNGHPEQHPNHDILPDGIGEQENVTWLPRCRKHHYYNPNNIKMRDWGWHPPTICTAVNSISPMLQIASLELGFEEIYLLGFDLGYTSDRAQNHVVENYSDDPRDKSLQDNTTCLRAHEVSKRDCPARIFNATPGGHLEIHPRVKMEDVLCSQAMTV